jgi:hypothetical protein
VSPFRRDRFAELVRRQLDLFATDDAELFAEAAEAERAYDDADRDDAEEAYGDYGLVLDSMAEALAEIRDTYAGTLDEDTAVAYEVSFDREATKRHPHLRGRL